MNRGYGKSVSVKPKDPFDRVISYSNGDEFGQRNPKERSSPFGNGHVESSKMSDGPQNKTDPAGLFVSTPEERKEGQQSSTYNSHGLGECCHSAGVADISVQEYFSVKAFDECLQLSYHLFEQGNSIDGLDYTTGRHRNVLSPKELSQGKGTFPSNLLHHSLLGLL
ncbi:hypothetical protein PoB_004124100 [Plakobranchus ocellatus]|uniref:Uncharacterized protein n=1 Tax=Plakobranchus ocellatus TaxID=259542 RepID=A0AAV4B2I7_9GAST|nr:hypothetical protein PoB_004124100 [Plakobranchus ocellatus]